MANIKISDLTAAVSAADANEFEINEAGTSKKVTGSQIKAYVNSADGALASLNTVDTAQIDDGAITTAKLDADAVDGTKIADDAIGNEHIATGAVNADSIASNAVGADELNVTGNGTAGQYLASDGDGTMTWTTLAVAAGGFSNMQVFTSPGTWTNPGNVTKVKVTVVGGGGSGGAGSNNYGGYGGSAGGAGAAIEVIPFPSGTNVPVTVGAGAAPQTSPQGSGLTGGTSSFGAYCSATGGGGGGARTSNTNVLGGNGGSGSGGTLNITGQNGHWGMAQPELNSGSVAGGSSLLGFGGVTNNPTPLIQPGKGYGGGGTGGQISSIASGGGSPGVVIVEY